MKSNIHPKLNAVEVSCRCGNVFEISSTLKSGISVEVCNNCHPHYTGKKKIIDTLGRVEKFASKYDKYKEKEKIMVEIRAKEMKEKEEKLWSASEKKKKEISEELLNKQKQYKSKSKTEGEKE